MPLEKIIKDKIAKHGAISVAEYMQDCLYHPQFGYYTTNDPFGENGDFTTAPEISQMFGELIGAWVADSWQKLGSPKRFNLVEGGPGRGTLMADILRTLNKIAPDCYAVADIIMLEISPLLIKVQQEKLAEHGGVTWVNDINEIGINNADTPIIFIGNEFLDAFPIKQFVGNREQLITENGGKLDFTIKAKDEEITEVCPEVEKFLQELKQSTNNGLALFIDYGAEANDDDGYNTLQALMDNKKVDILSNFGKADLTAHVNFSRVKRILGEQNCSYTTMGQFLTNLGLPIRAAKLLSSAASPEEQHDIEQAAYRLLHPSQMASLFKVLCWSSNSEIKPSGF